MIERETIPQELRAKLDSLSSDVALIKETLQRFSAYYAEEPTVERGDSVATRDSASGICGDDTPIVDGEQERCAPEHSELLSGYSADLEVLREQLELSREAMEGNAETISALKTDNQILLEEISAARSDTAASNLRLEEMQEALERALDERNATDAQMHSHQGTICSQEEEIQDLRETTDTLYREKELLTSDLAACRKELVEIRSRLEDCQRGNDALKANANLNSRLHAIIWPGFLSNEEFAPWKNALTQGLFSEPPSPRVLGIVTSLFSYNALSRMPELETRRMIEVVYELGVALYAWFEESGLDREACFQNACLWANAINEANTGSFSILVPEPDTPFDRRTMVSYSSDTNASPDVGGAKSWCIKDSEGRIQRQATVILT